MHLAEFAVRPGPGAPAHVRRVIDAVTFLPPPVAADLRLIVGALATSRGLVGHDQPWPVVWVRIARRAACTRLQMAVARPVEGEDGPLAADGPPLLQRAAARWGTLRDPLRVTVWFEIDDPAAAAGAPD